MRFRRDAPVVRAASESARAAPPSARDAAAPANVRGADRRAAAFRIDDPGPLATVQDLGRPGLASRGIARSGALDRGALRRGNRLVGNDEGAAAIEITLGGLRATAHRDLWIAVSGAPTPATIAGRAVGPHAAVPWRAGDELRIGWAPHGARCYLTVRGGIDVPVTAGSRASDRLARIGPPPLAAGDEIAIGTDAVAPVPPLDLAPWGDPARPAWLDLAEGPRAPWFAPEAEALLLGTRWRVAADADRVGVRLEGPALARTIPGELPSEGMVPGAVQIPPSGRPTILFCDGPVTGGYPVIAVVADASLDTLAQVRSGDEVRFRRSRGR
ncbi:biotin-dependent carboxyltransferase family protein [Microbacterium sp. LRZ72]|uniref:5-oxoprolinase subunit C family protein n=1 Tax=Microbacterium sp. LRZ72 TaxID=2942481 RepID=UPI0029B1CC82|nr:biotin-dependent carboxyltransferase family protein [Microbacterium sp. LRZ72]MDX2376648.1 biotin-dependent carboxyltransferase family protein [Microbacterium sp. LRZ72]